MSWTLESEGMEGLPESRAAWREEGREGERENIMFMACNFTHTEDVCSTYIMRIVVTMKAGFMTEFTQRSLGPEVLTLRAFCRETDPAFLKRP